MRPLILILMLGLAACQAGLVDQVTPPPARPSTDADGIITQRATIATVLPTHSPRAGNFTPPPLSPPANLPAVLRLPPGEGRVPAVIVVHGTSGVQTGGPAAMARLLTRAGFATLETDSWTPRGVDPANNRGQRPGTLGALPDMYGALRFLAAHPRVDPARIGIMGWSWGGIVALRAAREEVQQAYAGAGPRFAAFVAFYPGCSLWVPGEGVTAGEFDTGWPTGPLLILAAGRDDYDLRRGAADCTAFLAAIPGGPPARASLHVYPNATHGWDVRVGQSAWDPAARNLRGGTVTFTPDPGVTEDSQARLLAFMRRHLMGQ